MKACGLVLLVLGSGVFAGDTWRNSDGSFTLSRGEGDVVISRNADGSFTARRLPPGVDWLQSVGGRFGTGWVPGGPMEPRGGPTTEDVNRILVGCSWAQARGQYPDLRVEGSPLRVRFEALVARAHAIRSPLVDGTDWPLLLARQAAEALARETAHAATP